VAGRAADARMMFCDYCDGRLPPSALKCQNCGAPVTRSALISAERPAPELPRDPGTIVAMPPAANDVAELFGRSPMLIAGACAFYLLHMRR